MSTSKKLGMEYFLVKKKSNWMKIISALFEKFNNKKDSKQKILMICS